MICKRINLWDGMDCYDQVEGTIYPYLDLYTLSNTPEVEVDKKRPGLLVCPGGGYCMTSDREAEPVAAKFLAEGYVVGIVRYSCAPARHPQQLFDTSRAMWLMRENAEELQLDTDHIGVIGFSAGGHAAAALGVFWNEDYISESIGMPKGLNKPNALLLGYPVITSGDKAHRGSFDALLGDDRKDDPEWLEKMSLEKQVSQDTPHTFMWHTMADDCVPVENSLLFSTALAAEKIPFELHVYPTGWHGLSVCSEEVGTPFRYNADWVTSAIKWLNKEFDHEQKSVD